MKSTLLFLTLSMALATPSAFAKSELETLRSRCAEQERQIRLLEEENSRLRADGTEKHAPAAKSETVTAAPAKIESPKTEAPAASATPATYTVKAGDNLEKIARNIGVSSKKLAKANGMTTSSIIRPGQKLKVPGATASAKPEVAAAPSPKCEAHQHEIKAGETFASISKKHGISTDSLIAANPNVKPSDLRPGQIVNLRSAGGSTTTISAPASPSTKTPAPMEKADAPASKGSAPAETTYAATPATPPIPAAAKETPAATAEKKIRPVTIDGEMTYGEFAIKHGTDADRLNALNGLDLTTATVLAKGSELYVPVQQ
jgi:LysM repeat protein